MIILMSGNSSSGKTTFGELLEKTYRDTFKAVDPFAPIRQLYDNCYGVYPDSQERKAYVPPGCTLSLGDMLLEECFFRKRLDAYFSARYVKSEGAKLLKHGYVPVLIGVRDLEVAQYVLSLGSPVITVRISRTGEVVKPSDVLQYDILDLVKPHVVREFSFTNLNEYTTSNALELVYECVQRFKQGNLRGD